MYDISLRHANARKGANQQEKTCTVSCDFFWESLAKLSAVRESTANWPDRREGKVPRKEGSVRRRRDTRDCRATVQKSGVEETQRNLIPRNRDRKPTLFVHPTVNLSTNLFLSPSPHFHLSLLPRYPSLSPVIACHSFLPLRAQQGEIPGEIKWRGHAAHWLERRVLLRARSPFLPCRPGSLPKHQAPN